MDLLYVPVVDSTDGADVMVTSSGLYNSVILECVSLSSLQVCLSWIDSLLLLFLFSGSGGSIAAILEEEVALIESLSVVKI